MKNASTNKCRKNSEFRKKMKSASKVKYRSNVVFQNRVKSYSINKYQRFECFRNRLKESSIKKYSTGPLFRWKLKSFLNEKYRNDNHCRQNKKLKRNIISISQAIDRFQSSINEVPIYVCTVYIRSSYKKGETIRFYRYRDCLYDSMGSTI